MNEPELNLQKEDILIVDDTPENLHLLSRMLTQQGYNVRKALNGQMALMAVQTVAPDLILLDIMMPELDGYEVCQRLKSNPKTAEIPVIFLSALGDVVDKVKGFQVGAIDYVTKPFQFEEVLARVESQLALKAAQQKIRELNALLEERVKERTRQLEEANSKLLEMAFHDALTALPNRALLMERLEEAIACYQQKPDYQFAVLFLDCDRFKVVNDSLGHLVGDELLVGIAHRLKSFLRFQDTLARLGGDEFAILMSELEGIHIAIEIANKILESFNFPFQLQGHEVFINASIGIVMGNLSHNKPEYLLRDADTAMYRAKASGKGQYHIFDPQMHQEALQRLQIETNLRQALNQQELTVHYQPIINLLAGKIAGFEALVRWYHPTNGFMSPDLFIPVAEETGLIAPLGQWVMKEACTQLRQWQLQGLTDESIFMSVNLSVRQFAQPDLIEQIDWVLEQTQLKPESLKLEITESAIMDNAKTATLLFQKLRQRRIQLSIDDFGTGYSSLSYLHSFPVDTLKVDKSFVQRLNGTTESLGIIPVIVNITKTMGMSVVAEGIETCQQLEQLRLLNCGFGQGYFFSKPLAAENIVPLLTQTQQW